MKSTAAELDLLINKHLAALKNLSDNEFAFKPSEKKWSKKEIVGHLIDSAQNNIRRFIIAQYEQTPFIVYDQDKWVIAVDYHQWNRDDLINLWYLQNKQIVYILKNITAEISLRTCKTQDIHTIEWLAKDYVKHLLHHLHVVLDLEPVAYP